MKNLIGVLVTSLMALLFVGANGSLYNDWWENKPVNQILTQLGGAQPKHQIKLDTFKIKQGHDLVFKGQTLLASGKLSKPISKYFVCTSCHNSAQEDPDIRFSDPDARLPYTVSKGIPMLQGTTFWGIVNRESWYNDDYYLKYGEGVRAANESLREAIQLCAIECSQGRPLERWEEDAILSYYWTLELNMNDLRLPDELKNRLTKTLKENRQDSSLIEELKKYYLTASPATFDHVLEDKKKGYEVIGDLSTGEMIYENSCRHCHQEGGVSDFLLDYSPKTFKFLKKHMFRNDDDFSIYQIIRRGTYASPGARPYMPHYPKEKMSDSQIESLRLYILAKAEN